MNTACLSGAGLSGIHAQSSPSAVFLHLHSGPEPRNTTANVFASLTIFSSVSFATVAARPPCFSSSVSMSHAMSVSVPQMSRSCSPVASSVNLTFRQNWISPMPQAAGRTVPSVVPRAVGSRNPCSDATFIFTVDLLQPVSRSNRSERYRITATVGQFARWMQRGGLGLGQHQSAVADARLVECLNLGGASTSGLPWLDTSTRSCGSLRLSGVAR